MFFRNGMKRGTRSCDFSRWAVTGVVLRVAPSATFNGKLFFVYLLCIAVAAAVRRLLVSIPKHKEHGSE